MRVSGFQIYGMRFRHLVSKLAAVAVLLLAFDDSVWNIHAVAEEAAAIVPVRGIVRASFEAKLSTNLDAQVKAIHIKEGEAFKKGDVLIEFDCREDEARLAAAQAIQEEKAVAYRSAKYLLARNAGSKQDVQIAAALHKRASADADVISAKLTQCRVSAPFDGYVSALNINPYEMPVSGEPLVGIVHKRNPEIELIVPSNWLNWVKKGVEFHFMVDETGETYGGTVERTGAVVDAVSQTVKLFGSFDGQEIKVLPGMSGTAIFPYDAVN